MIRDVYKPAEGKGIPIIGLPGFYHSSENGGGRIDKHLKELSALGFYAASVYYDFITKNSNPKSGFDIVCKFSLDSYVRNLVDSAKKVCTQNGTHKLGIIASSMSALIATRSLRILVRDMGLKVAIASVSPISGWNYIKPEARKAMMQDDKIILSGVEDIARKINRYIPAESLENVVNTNSYHLDGVVEVKPDFVMTFAAGKDALITYEDMQKFHIALGGEDLDLHLFENEKHNIDPAKCSIYMPEFFARL